jgi:DNA primase
LYSTSGAYNYLRNRGLSEQTIAQYSLGYTDGRVLSIEYASDFKIAHEAGLINNQGYEVLSHRIIIPNINGRHNVDFLMGRTVINDRIKYLGIRLPKPMYGFAMNCKSPILFMAEGQFDWLILQQWGYPAIILSGSHLPRYHLMALREKMIVIVPDNDDTGMQAARKVHASIQNSIILDYASLGVKDVGDLGMMEDGEAKFNNLIKEQEWFKTIPLLRAHWMKWFPSSLGRQSLH